jgi:uncharacterized repeat protein (TIGR02543 family)
MNIRQDLKRFLSIMITICVIFTTTVASPLSTMAEAPEGAPVGETAAITEQTAAEAEPEAVGQASAPVAEAPAAEAPAPAPAPETSAPAPETSAPAPETPTPAPQTAEPASVPETSAPKAAAPAAESQTAAPAAEKQPEETRMTGQKEETPAAAGQGSGTAGEGNQTTAAETDVQSAHGEDASAEQSDAGSAAGDAAAAPPQSEGTPQTAADTAASAGDENESPEQQLSGLPETENAKETGAESETETETETETEETYPAQSFTGRANNITVSVTAGEGVFPKGTTMVTTAISAQRAISIANAAADDQTEVKDAIGVDISFRDASGREIEPKDGRSVQVRMTVGASSALEGDNFSVVHQKDNGVVETVTENASARGAVFAADSFSIYVITGTGTVDQEPAVETWNFYGGTDNTTLLSTQMVKNGETLNAPASPEKDGFIFRGWAYSAEAGTVDIAAFTTRTVEVSSTRTVNLYPVFEAKLYVFFMDNYNRVWQTKEGVSGSKISVSDVTLPLGSEQSVTGWYMDSTLSGDAVTEVTLSSENVTLYPKVESGHYLFFSTGEGASYVAPQFVAAGASTVQPESPTRSGYTFVRWTDAEGDFTFGQKLSENKILSAIWKAKSDTKYTVIFWKQSVNDNKDAFDSQKTYDYMESETRTGTTGQEVSPQYKDRNKGYTGFWYNASKSVPVTINGDGTTILNVYYDRNLLRIDFMIR